MRNREIRHIAPSRKSKSVNKRFTNEASPETEVRSSSKIKQRKKRLTDKLGPQWTRGELERFYASYRKHGGDWKKVAASVRNNRSVDMVEALFNINRAYLSLPEGTASVAGLIAMMTDHYSVIEGSESEGEGHDASEVPRKQQKHKRAKVLPRDISEEVIPPHLVASAEGCLSFLKQTQVYVNERRATGKRTPRFPVPSTDNSDAEGSTPPNKRYKKQLDADDTHVAALLTLADASRTGEGSPNCRTELNESMPVRLGNMLQAKEAQSKHNDRSMSENGVRISRDRSEKKGTPGKDGALLITRERVVTAEVPQKGKNVRVEGAKGNDSDDSGEACNANERLRTKPQKGAVYVEASRGKKSQDTPKKINKKLLCGGISNIKLTREEFKDELEVLQTLTDMSVSLHPADLTESESSTQFEEEVIANKVGEKSNTSETVSTSHHREKAKQAGPEDSLLHAIPAADNRKQKSAQEFIDDNVVSIGELRTSRRKRKPKVLEVEASEDSIQNKSLFSKELAEDDTLKTLVKETRLVQGQTKQLKVAKTSEESLSTSDKTRTGPEAVVSATQVTGLVPASLPQKPPNRRKMSLKKILQERADTTHDKPHSYTRNSEHEWLKKKLSTCLSNPLVRRRCIFEWFYSAIDYPWFAKMEFIDYLNHVGLGHVPRLTRLEWSVIKSSLGRPRRFSERFLHDERDKLQQYRKSVRKHYTDLRAGAREGLHTDLARPLSVGNRVIAIHPKTREIRDGNILTVDHNKCNVLFDDLGVDLVMDIDIMPLTPLEYMPEGLRRQFDKSLSVSKEIQINGLPDSDVSVLFPPVLENAKFSMNPLVKQDDMNGPILLGKVLTNTTNQSIATNIKAKGLEIQQAPMLQHTPDAQEMEPEIIEIVSGSKSKAQAMVDAAVKAASSVKKDEDAGNMVRQTLSAVNEHKRLDNSIVSIIKDPTKGNLEYRQSRSPSNTAEPMTNAFISQDASDKNETQMPSELITSCVATCLMIQMCTEKQYPPADVAQLMEAAVSGLQPQCPQNMPIYREIQTCMGWIKTQIMSLVKT